MFAFQRILVPTDFSQCSERALQAALSLAARMNSEVHLLHVGNRPGSKTYEDPDATVAEVESLETNEAALRNAYTSAAAAVTAETGLPLPPADSAGYFISGGDPAEEIVRVAEELHADLVVIGTHGRTTVKQFFVGSTAERVVKNANCAVLAVKPEGYPFLRD